MLFDSSDIQELTTNIKLFHLIFISENIGGSVLSRSEKEFLRQRGYNPYLNRRKPDYIKYNYYFGQAEKQLTGKLRLKDLTFSQYKEWFKQNQEHIPVSRADRESIKKLKKLAYDSIKKLQSDMQTDLATLLADVNKKERLRVEKQLKQPTKGKSLKEEVLNQISDHLAKKTRYWTMRFERITNYVMHASYQEGILSGITKEHGLNAKVYFQVRAGACEHCQRLYLRPDGKPKVFFIRQILLNGNNIGRKVDQWKPTIYPLHPNCRCLLTYFPSKTGRDIHYNERSGTYKKNLR